MNRIVLQKRKTKVEFLSNSLIQFKTITSCCYQRQPDDEVSVCRSLWSLSQALKQEQNEAPHKRGTALFYFSFLDKYQLKTWSHTAGRELLLCQMFLHSWHMHRGSVKCKTHSPKPRSSKRFNSGILFCLDQSRTKQRSDEKARGWED